MLGVRPTLSGVPARNWPYRCRDEGIELFVRREDADAFLEEIRRDDPELADALRVERIELDA